MYFDLARTQPSNAISVSVCIVGSGPAGIGLARWLNDMGIDCLMLESGSRQPANPEIRADIRYDRREYRGATLGRASGFGGTSAIWGGQLLPIAAEDMGARQAQGIPSWPLYENDLACHFNELEKWLGVDALPYSKAAVEQLGLPNAGLHTGIFRFRFSKWIPFRARNLGLANLKALRHSKLTQVWIHACASEWQCDEHRSISRVLARSENGHVLEVVPKAVVICAGTLESTRCVLELQEQLGLLPVSASRQLGRYLHDHLSVRIAKVRILDGKRFNALFAPVFHGQTMHSHKIELSGEAAWSRNLPSLYVHFVAEVSENSGFGIVRDTFRAMQRANVIAIFNALRKLPFALPGVIKLGYWRIVRKRLAYPTDAEVFLHVDFEQPALRGNRVYLGNEHPDGRRRDLHIDWDLSCDTGQIVRTLEPNILTFWADNRLGEVAELSFFPSNRSQDECLNNLYDIYHPAGTARMAETPEAGVVDPNLLLFGTRNAYVLSSAVFPSMGSANPTFTLLTLAVRLAHRLGELLRHTSRSRSV